MEMWARVQDAIVGFTFCWIFWLIFNTLRRYLLARAATSLQEKVLQRIDTAEAMLTLTSSEAGRQFLDSITQEKSPATSPLNRILFGAQAGIVLICFGASLLSLHHVIADPQGGFIICGTGALGLGLGFLIAAGASVFLSRRLGLIHDSNA